MELVASLTSPFARKIRVILEEKSLSYDLHESIPWDSDSDVINYNPLGKVPALVDQGKIWTDSAVIADYLEYVSPKVQLIPADSLQALEVKQVEALADGICEAAIAIFLERKRPSDQQSPSWIERQQGKIDSGLSYLDNALNNKRFVCHDAFSLGDISIICLLDWYTFRFPESQWRTDFPHLANYFNGLIDRASFKNTAPPS